MKIRASLVYVVGSMLLVSAPFAQASLVRAASVCSAGSSMNIVAHPDDDLLFINPAIQNDITSGTCETSIFMTSGDSGAGLSHAQDREEGMRVAYAGMASASNAWTNTQITDGGHTVQLSTLNANPNIRLMFMRLPDGGSAWPQLGLAGNNYQTMNKLWQSTLTSITPIDNTASYTRQAVIDVLKDQIVAAAPDTVRTQNFVDPCSGNDHPDHETAAYFAQAAHRASNLRHTFVGYRGYDIQSLPATITGATLATKQNTFFSYNAYDDPTCVSVASCNTTDNGQHFITWLARSYAAGNDTYQYETLDGDSGSRAGNTADTGKLPAAVQFGSDLWTFYYDATDGDLRFAKASSASPSAWTFGALDTAGDVGQYPSAVVFNNVLHVFYYDVTNGDLRHAWLTSGGSWQFATLDGNPSATSHYSADVGLMPAVTVYGTSLQLFYFDNTNQNLRHAWSDGTSWNFENLDGDSGSILHNNTNTGYDPAVTVYNGTLQLFYYDATGGNIRHVWENAGWHQEDLDGYTTSAGRLNTNLGLNPTVTTYNGTLQLFYYDQSDGALRHAWVDTSGAWHFESLDGNGSTVMGQSGFIGATPNVSVDGTTLHVLAYNVTTHSLRHYWSSPTQGWQAETLDGPGTNGLNIGSVSNDAGQDPTAISFAGRLHIFYYQPGDTNFRHIVW